VNLYNVRSKSLNLMTKTQGVYIIAAYTVIIYVITWIFSRGYGKTKLQFLLAERLVGKWQSAFSIAATWVWAPSLFIAAQKAYLHGIAGVFWFTVPNVACLIIFAFFADRIRKLLPDGFTLSGFIRTRFSRRVQIMYLVELFGLATCSFAVQLLAGAKILTMVTGMSYLLITFLMAAIAIVYSAVYGLKASVITDYFQMVLIIVVGGLLIGWSVSEAGGFSTIAAGLGGKSGTYISLLSTDSLELALTFGIPVTIGLLAGPFGDQSFWQRAFATERQHVKSAFIWGALIFALVPLIMSQLGFIAAGSGLVVHDPATVNLETVLAFLPPWTIVPFIFVLLSGLVSTLDSNLCAISSLVGHDIIDELSWQSEVKDRSPVISRLSMVVVSIIAIAIANIPNLKIVHLFLFYGTLRASTLLPTIMTIMGKNLSDKGLFYGIILSLAIGLPLFAYGNFANSTIFIICGSLFTVLASGTMAVLWKIESRG